MVIDLRFLTGFQFTLILAVELSIVASIFAIALTSDLSTVDESQSNNLFTIVVIHGSAIAKLLTADEVVALAIIVLCTATAALIHPTIAVVSDTISLTTSTEKCIAIAATSPIRSPNVKCESDFIVVESVLTTITIAFGKKFSLVKVIFNLKVTSLI